MLQAEDVLKVCKYLYVPSPPVPDQDGRGDQVLDPSLNGETQRPA
jgi:hypothetical protein